MSLIRFRFVERQQPAWVRSIVAVVTWFATFAAAIFVTGKLPTGYWIIGALGAATLAAIRAVRLLLRRGNEGTATLDNQTVRLSSGAKEWEISAALVRAGWEEPKSEAAVFELANGVRFTIGVDSEGAEQLLDHLGVSAEKRTATFGVRPRINPFTIGFVTWFLSLFAIGMPLGFAKAPHWMFWLLALTPLIGVLSGYLFGKPTITIGRDGLRINDFPRHQFVAYTNIDRVKRKLTYWNGKVTTQALEIVELSGKVIYLPLHNMETLEAIELRVEQAMQARSQNAGVPIEALARGGRSVSTWLDELGRLTNQAVGFREQAFAHRDFARVLDDSTAPIEQRVGAALALRVADPEQARVRIRAAADASADRALREALCAASEAELDLDAIDRVTRGSHG